VLDQPAPLRAGDELHAAVLLVHIIEGDPDRDGVERRQRPVIGVLVPRHGAGAARRLDEEMAPPHVEVRPEDALNEVENPRVHHELVQVGARMVPLPHLVRGLARLEQRQQVGQLAIDADHLRRGEDGRQPEQVALLVIKFLLGRGEAAGRGRHDGVAGQRNLNPGGWRSDFAVETYRLLHNLE
jgi:hypothetical protein